MNAPKRPGHEFIIERAIKLAGENYTCGQIAKSLGIGVGYLRGVLQRNQVVLQYSLNIQHFISSTLSNLQTISELATHHDISEERVQDLVEYHNLPYLKSRPLPDLPTRCLPGSLEKIEELRRRAEANEELWHPDDVDYAGHRDGLDYRERRETMPCAFRTAG